MAHDDDEGHERRRKKMRRKRKEEEKRNEREHEDLLLIATVVDHDVKTYKIDGMCGVPPRLYRPLTALANLHRPNPHHPHHTVCTIENVKVQGLPKVARFTHAGWRLFQGLPKVHLGWRTFMALIDLIFSVFQFCNIHANYI